MVAEELKRQIELPFIIMQTHSIAKYTVHDYSSLQYMLSLQKIVASFPGHSHIISHRCGENSSCHRKFAWEWPRNEATKMAHSSLKMCMLYPLTQLSGVARCGEICSSCNTLQ